MTPTLTLKFLQTENWSTFTDTNLYKKLVHKKIFWGKKINDFPSQTRNIDTKDTDSVIAYKLRIINYTLELQTKTGISAFLNLSSVEAESTHHVAIPRHI